MFAHEWELIASAVRGYTDRLESNLSDTGGPLVRHAAGQTLKMTRKALAQLSNQLIEAPPEPDDDGESQPQESRAS